MIRSAPDACTECGNPAPADGLHLCKACDATRVDRIATGWWEPEPPQPDLLMGSRAVDDAAAIERVRAAMAPKRQYGSQRWVAKR
ncbi:MAG: hypothetical protein ACR2OO_05195 [Thermomicrobiales bacterium]